MLFNSVTYILFLIVVVLIYYALRSVRLRNIWLLCSSYFFYMQWNAKYGLLILSVTLFTYIGAIIISHDKIKSNNKYKRFIFVLFTILSLAILLFFKYLGMLFDHLNLLFRVLNVKIHITRLNILLPVGISFFTLQSLGYLIDVYRGDINCEYDFIDYALFVSFFPQLVAGPIERSRNLLNQFKNKISFKYMNLQKGFYYILYGLMIKMVIADNLAILVDKIYSNPVKFSGLYLVIATLAFSIQIYCDFYGYSIIAKGSSILLGINLMDNFNSPYLSCSIREFWHRWHISLSTWFRDYLYIPLGGNRRGFIKNNINILIIFLISGLWHGASISFVLWGLINGVYNIIENIFNKFVKFKMNIITKILSILFVYIIICFSWIFFRAGSFTNTKIILTNLFCNFKMANLIDLLNVWNLPYKMTDGTVFGILVLTIVDILKYNHINLIDKIIKLNPVLRYVLSILLIFFIIIFGCYGGIYNPKQFIYFQF